VAGQRDTGSGAALQCAREGGAAGRRRERGTGGGTMGNRPLGVTILAALASVALILSIVHFLQALGIIPYFIGQISIRDFNLWYVLLWGLMIWVWLWVVRALLVMDPSAWLFLLIVSGFNLIFEFTTILTTPTTTTDLSVSFVLNIIIFGYTILPSTKASFGIE
jgi:hypothetical protein